MGLGVNLYAQNVIINRIMRNPRMAKLGMLSRYLQGPHLSSMSISGLGRCSKSAPSEHLKHQQ